MTKPKPKKVELEPGAKSSIAQFDECVRRMKLGTLDKPTMDKFRDLLFKNVETSTVTGSEQDVLEAILRRERNGRNKKKMTISDSLDGKASKYYFWLNAIEAERLTETCTVKSNTPPASFHATFGLECKLSRDIEADRFLVYIPEEIKATFQYTDVHFQKTLLGQGIDLEDLPKAKTIWHFRDLNTSDFNRFFKANEEIDTVIEEKEEPIIF
jgi:hypothetical protein